MSVTPASEPALTKEPEVACFVNCSEPLTYYDRDTSSWRTFQDSLAGGGSPQFAGKWPRSGTMRNGIAYQRPPSAPLKSATEYSPSVNDRIWPTPRASEWKGV